MTIMSLTMYERLNPDHQHPTLSKFVTTVTNGNSLLHLVIILHKTIINSLIQNREKIVIKMIIEIIFKFKKVLFK